MLFMLYTNTAAEQCASLMHLNGLMGSSIESCFFNQHRKVFINMRGLVSKTITEILAIERNGTDATAS